MATTISAGYRRTLWAGCVQDFFRYWDETVAMRILVVDDEQAVRESLTTWCSPSWPRTPRTSPGCSRSSVAMSSDSPAEKASRWSGSRTEIVEHTAASSAAIDVKEATADNTGLLVAERTALTIAG